MPASAQLRSKLPLNAIVNVDGAKSGPASLRAQCDLPAPDIPISDSLIKIRSESFSPPHRKIFRGTAASMPKAVALCAEPLSLVEAQE
jgi:hypothetical protein